MRILFFIVLIAQRPAGIPTIRVGQTLHGTLSATDSLHIDSTHYKMYQFTARPGRIITIDLASDDFDPVLIVRGDDLEHAIIDDDGGPRCAARISRAFQSA